MVAPTGADVIMQQLKGYITKKAGRRMWQKSFYNHIIRNAQDYEGGLEYIRTSPDMWIRNSHYFEKSEE